MTKTVTVAEAPKHEGATAPETARAIPAPPPPGTPPAAPSSAAPPPATTQAGSPEDILALQYRLINTGDYEGAYALFDQSSKQLVSLDQYRSYFEANAPYSITDYSFPSVDDQGNTATVQAALTANSSSGQESYEVSQPLVREGGAWRVVMRGEQASSFAANGQEPTGQYGQQYDPNLPNPDLPNPNLPNPDLPNPHAPDLPDFHFGGGHHRGLF